MKVRLHGYDIDCAIISGIDDEPVWEGTISVFASNKKDARKLALSLMEDSVYDDPRIDPKRVISYIAHTETIIVSDEDMLPIGGVNVRANVKVRDLLAKIASL